MNVVADGVEQLLGGEDLHLHEDRPVAFAGLADAAKAFVVLLAVDMAVGQEHVAERLDDLIGGGEDDVAALEIDPLHLLAAAAVEPPRRAIFMDLHQDFRKRSLGDLGLVQR